MKVDEIHQYVEANIEPESTVGQHFRYLFEHIEALNIEIASLEVDAQELRQIMKRCPGEYCRRKMGAM